MDCFFSVLYLYLKKVRILYPNHGPKTYRNFLHQYSSLHFKHATTIKIKHRKIYRSNLQKTGTHLHLLFDRITLRKRYLLKLPIFHKVPSKIFGVVKSESLNSFSRFWKKFLHEKKPQESVIRKKYRYSIKFDEGFRGHLIRIH